ncbi:MAG: hypothetical protein Tsb0020_55060 [Haliangiales bacterium]
MTDDATSARTGLKPELKLKIALLLAPDGPRRRAAMSTCERAAMRACLDFCARHGGSVTCIAFAPAETAAAMLEDALERGVERAICISDPDGDGLDYLGVASVLAEGAVRVGADLIVFGNHRDGGEDNPLGPAVAELLGRPHLTGVVALESIASPARPNVSAPPIADDAPTIPTLRAPELTPPAPHPTFDRRFMLDSAPTAPIPVITRAQAEAPQPDRPAIIALHRGLDRIYRLRCPLPAVLSIESAAADPAEAAASRDAGPADDDPSAMPADTLDDTLDVDNNSSGGDPDGDSDGDSDNDGDGAPAGDGGDDHTEVSAAAGDGASRVEYVVPAELGIDLRPLSHRRRLASQLVARPTAEKAPPRLAASGEELLAWLVADGYVR